MENNWIETTLEDVCNISMGQSPSSETYNTLNRGLPFFQGKAEFTKLYPVAVKWCSIPKVTAEKDDILLSVRAPVGSLNIADKKCCIGRGLAAIRYMPCYKFIYYYLITKQAYLNSLGSGSTFVAISGKDVKTLAIPLPPLPEQRAIVAKLETLLSELDNAVHSLKTAKAQIKTYRQSVLKAAFTGKLTEEWRAQQSDLPTAEELLQQVNAERQKYYEQQLADYKAGKIKTKPKQLTEIVGLTKKEIAELPEIPHKWNWVKLGNLTNLITKGSSPNWQGYNYIQNGEVIFVTSENVLRGSLDISEPKYVEMGFYQTHPTYALKLDDVLLNIVGASIGRSCIYNIDFKATINQAVSLIRLVSIIPSNYISTYLNSSFAESHYNKNKVETARANISLQDVNNVPIPLSSIYEIDAVNNEIETRFAIAEQIEQSIDENLLKAEALKQSLLKQAFEGKLLTEQELAETRLAPDWEPAEKLLERIKSSKGEGNTK